MFGVNKFYLRHDQLISYGLWLKAIKWSRLVLNTHTYLNHTSDRFVIIILFMSQFSIFDTRYIFGLANQGFQGLRLYDLDCFDFNCISYSYTILLNVNSSHDSICTKGIWANQADI